MIETGGGKTWFTAAEIADLALPGLPKSKRKVNERADKEDWKAAISKAGLPLARMRKGRGGGLEFHVSLLPSSAQAELVAKGLVFVSPQTHSADHPDAANDCGNGQRWRGNDGQSE